MSGGEVVDPLADQSLLVLFIGVTICMGGVLLLRRFSRGSLQADAGPVGAIVASVVTV